jgi:hypothetical protein
VEADPEDTLLVGARNVPASDLPRELSERVEWVSTIARVVRAVRPLLQPSDVRRLDAVAAHASLHHREMGELDSLDLERYARHLERSGRAPPRGHDIERLMHWVEDGMERLEHRVADDVPDEWACPALPECRAHNITITAIHTKASLNAEARAMRHCVATYAPQLVAGKLALYHVEHATGPSTLMLASSGGRWRLRQIAGPFNEPVPAEVTVLVYNWLYEQTDAETAAVLTA